MQISVSDVESRRFGIIVARARNFSATDRDSLLRFCKDNRVGLAIVRAPASNPQAAHALEDIGARLMDTLVDYRIEIAGDAALPECKGFALRAAGAPDIEEIRGLARRIFTNYPSHYTADPRLDPGAVGEGYAEWAASHVGGKSREAIVALIGGKIVGFSAVEFDKENLSGRLALVGIDEAARGKGIYPAFLRHHLARCKEQGGRNFFAATQITNFRSQKAWLRAGFEPYAIEHTFHLWLAS